MMEQEHERGWNIFANVLGEILKEHGRSWYWLQSHLQAHSYQVQRLRDSFKYPTICILSQKIVDTLMDDPQLQLTEEEKQRLQVALLAAAVERLLMNRLNPNISREDALDIAEEVFDALLKLVQEKEHTGEKNLISAVRKGPVLMSNANPTAPKLERALSIYDRAMLSLHLSHKTSLADEKEVEAQHALMDFKLARAILDKSDEKTKSSDQWQQWYQEVQEGLNAANERLAELGVLP